MFELYSTPSLTYCVDGLMSFYQNSRPSSLREPFTSNGLVISFNTASTSVIPVLRGKGIMNLAKRCGPCFCNNLLIPTSDLEYHGEVLSHLNIF